MTSIPNEVCRWDDKVFFEIAVIYSSTKTLSQINSTCLVKSNGFVIFVFGTGCVETDAFCHKKANLHALDNACAVARSAHSIRK